jgi:hypothetical protein
MTDYQILHLIFLVLFGVLTLLVTVIVSMLNKKQ